VAATATSRVRVSAPTWNGLVKNRAKFSSVNTGSENAVRDGRSKLNRRK
jgi:hypothetical protein